VIDRVASFALVTSVDRAAVPVVAFLADGGRAEIHIAPPEHSASRTSSRPVHPSTSRCFARVLPSGSISRS
jgi:hypothetical protein